MVVAGCVSGDLVPKQMTRWAPPRTRKQHGHVVWRLLFVRVIHLRVSSVDLKTLL